MSRVSASLRRLRAVKFEERNHTRTAARQGEERRRAIPIWSLGKALQQSTWVDDPKLQALGELRS